MSFGKGTSSNGSPGGPSFSFNTVIVGSHSTRMNPYFYAINFASVVFPLLDGPTIIPNVVLLVIYDLKICKSSLLTIRCFDLPT